MTEYLDVDTSVAPSPEILRLIRNRCSLPGCDLTIVFRVGGDKDFCREHAFKELGRRLVILNTEVEGIRQRFDDY